jgi:hypothetical protein
MHLTFLIVALVIYQNIEITLSADLLINIKIKFYCFPGIFNSTFSIYKRSKANT